MAANVAYKPIETYNKAFDTIQYQKKDLFNELCLFGERKIVKKYTEGSNTALIYTVPENFTLFITGITCFWFCSSVTTLIRRVSVFTDIIDNLLFEILSPINLTDMFTMPIIIPLRINKNINIYHEVYAGGSSNTTIYGFLIPDSQIPLFL